MSTPQKDPMLRRAFNAIDNDPEGTIGTLGMVVVAGLVIFAFIRGFFF